MTTFTRDVAVAKPATPAKEVWNKINRDTLPPGLQSLYDQFHTANKLAKEAKASFCDAARQCMDIPAGKEAYFSDRFGELSFAFLDEKTAKAAAKAVDFRSLMKR